VDHVPTGRWRVTHAVTIARPMAKPAKTIKAKRKCCKDTPRCKRCAVVCKRLEEAGYLERESKRRWRVIEVPKKKAVRKARA
jgi:hypothetical protein